MRYEYIMNDKKEEINWSELAIKRKPTLTKYTSMCRRNNRDNERRKIEEKHWRDKRGQRRNAA